MTDSDCSLCPRRSGRRRVPRSASPVFMCLCLFSAATTSGPSSSPVMLLSALLADCLWITNGTMTLTSAVDVDAALNRAAVQLFLLLLLIAD